MADGGDGTAEVLRRALGGTWRRARVTSPLGEMREARYVWCPARRLAVVEMAQASGIALIEPRQRHPFATTTFGTGELMLAAVKAGARRIVLGVGGSATVDAGAGALQALGCRFFRADGSEICEPLTGLTIAECVRAACDAAQRLLRGVTIEVLCDVRNPMHGPCGAARAFAPQKGATPADVAVLARNLRSFMRLAPGGQGSRAAAEPGAGAAGGLGAGLAAFLGARLVEGAPRIAELIGLRQALRGADFVVTGEGSFDAQSFMGKAPGEVLRIAREMGVPSAVLAGRVAVSRGALRRRGCVMARSIVPPGMSEAEAMERGAELVEVAARQVLRDLTALKGSSLR